MSVWRVLAALLLVAVASGCARSPAADGAEPLLVAAASDLRPAFEELGARFEADTGTQVTFSFGSSGQLKEQVLQGAPFDLFASADVGFVDEVVAAGRGDGSTTQTYGFGRLVVWSRDVRSRSLAALADPEVRTVAIANPEHAPYGRAARQALQAAGVWEAVQPKLVLGDNVSDTLRLATSGNADAAVVALSLVAGDGPGDWAEVPAALHDPLEQALVVTARDPKRAASARSFAAFLASPKSRATMQRHGFVLPGEDPGT